MLALNCPACGAPMPFQSRASVFGVCEYCRTMCVRTDVDLKAIGKQAMLLQDMSPLQIGARGVYRKVDFALVGRVQLTWGEEDGHWNEWYAWFSDGRTGWVADAQGQYFVSFPTALPSPPPRREAMREGAQLRIEGTTFTVDDVREVECVRSQGELPFRAEPGRRLLAVDCIAEAGRGASLTFGDGEPELYVGEWLEADELRLSGLRHIEGWS